MSPRRVRTVFGKELSDHLRDRRALLSAAFGVLIGPLLIGLLLHQVASERRELQDLTVPVVGLDRAPGLGSWLEMQEGVALAELDGDPEKTVRSGREEVVLEIDEEYGGKMAIGRRAEVRLYYDSSKGSARGRAGRVRELLFEYSSQIGALRLAARGVAPEALRPLDIEDVEISNAQRRAASVLGMIPMMALVAIFVAGIGSAADGTAGERERGSLEALLANPVSTADVVVGKWLAASAIAVAGGALTVAILTVILRETPLYELGIRVVMEPWQIALTLMLLFPLMLTAPAIEMLIATYARSFKEAQSYLGFVMFLPTAPVLVVTFMDLGERPWLPYVPVVGQARLMTSVITGDLPPWEQFAGSAAGTLLIAAACLFAMTRLFRSEKIVFGR